MFCSLAASKPTVVVRGNRYLPYSSNCSADSSRIPSACNTGSNGGFREWITDGVLEKVKN